MAADSVRIRLLDPAVANQIAAGEVVERPASVVKELVENAVDAGATRVWVRIAEGGKSLVRVTDNGSGMSAEEAHLAFARHATSKISTAEELLGIATFGFRGEALASILAVAKVTLTTRRPQDEAGVRLTGGGGVHLQQEPAGCAVGTDIAVEDLFFNVPARLKFLRTPSTETGRIIDFLETLGLARPDLHVVLWAGDKKVLDLPPDRDAHARASAVLGPAVAKRLHPVFESGEFEVTGLLSDPALTQTGPSQLRLLVGGRPVSDRTLQQAVLQAYGTLLERGQYPVGILRVDGPPGSVDVNVHPAKTEVRFAAGANVFGAVVRAVRAMLAETPWVKRELPTAEPWQGQGHKQGQEQGREQGQGQGQAQGQGQQQGQGQEQRQQQEPGAPAWPPPESRQAWPATIAPARPAPPENPPPQAQLLPLQGQTNGQWAALRYVGQIGKCFLVCEGDGAMLVIDQHAAHERVLFEQFVVALRTGNLPSQRMLVPLAVPLSPNELAALSEEPELLARLGFDVAAAGARLARVHAHPHLLAGRDVAAHVQKLAASLAAGGRDQVLETRLERHAATLACHAAFRAGDLLQPADAAMLLAQMDGVDLSAYCPHGRPVWAKVALGDIGRWFGRA